MQPQQIFDYHGHITRCAYGRSYKSKSFCFMTGARESKSGDVIAIQDEHGTTMSLTYSVPLVSDNGRAIGCLYHSQAIGGSMAFLNWEEVTIIDVERCKKSFYAVYFFDILHNCWCIA